MDSKKPPGVGLARRDEKLERKSRIDNVVGLSIRHPGHPPPEDLPQTPDWELWSAMSKAPLWQLAALSLNIDPGPPDHITQSDVMPDAASMRAEFGEEFERRLFIALDNLSPEGPLAPVTSYSGAHEGPCAVVTLADFATFAETLPKPWRLPEPFRRAVGAVALSGSGGVGGVPQPASAKRWTPKKKEELKRYVEKHGTNAAAKKFGISDSRVRQVLGPQKAAQTAPSGSSWPPPSKR
jgi:hypothetical protein